MYFDPLPTGYCTPAYDIVTLYPLIYPWYIESPAYGILFPIRVVYGPLPMVFWLQYTWDISNPCLWHFDPITHGISNPSLWYIKPANNGVLNLVLIIFWPLPQDMSNHLTMGYQSSYPLYIGPVYDISNPYLWYFDPPPHGISNRLHMVYRTHYP